MTTTYYADISPGYNELYREEQLGKLRIIYTQLSLKEKHVLDVGCGTGISAEFDWRITGIDPVKELSQQAKMPVVEGKAEHLPFSDDLFDAVICVTVFHHIKDGKQALAEMQRVSSGPIVISLLKTSSGYDQHRKLIEQTLHVNKTVEEQHDLILFCDSGISMHSSA